MDTPFPNITTYAYTRNQIKDKIKDQIKIKQQIHWQKQNSKLSEIKKNNIVKHDSNFKREKKSLLTRL